MSTPTLTPVHPVVRSIGTWLAFVLIGVVTAAIGEFQYSVLIRGAWGDWYGSMFFNTLYLTAAYIVTRILFRLIDNRAAAYLVCTGLAATVGLAVEWFVIGNSPWGNPAASEIGMAAYWASFVIVPLIFVDPDPALRGVKRFILAYGLVYTTIVLLGHWLIPTAEWRFAFHIWTVVFGYLGLIVACVSKVVRATARTPVVRLTG
jgi:hypothetical protein